MAKAKSFSGKTKIAAVLDRSGSMAGLVDEVIGGYNAWLDAIVAETANATITTTLFDTEYDVIDSDRPVLNATKLDRDVYFARGMTALNDAIMKSITELEGKVGKKDRALVVVVTDGGENSSQEYPIAAGGTKTVRDAITEREARGNWTFVYLSAAPSAFADSAGYGVNIGSTRSFEASPMGTRTAFSSITASTRSYLQSDQPSTMAYFEGTKTNEDDDDKN